MSTVEFRSNLQETMGVLPHFWEHTVGSGHASLALRADWQAQLRRCHEELGFQHVRFHALLSDDMGTLIDEENELHYSFFNADQIWDFLLSIGMKPFVELSFMPSAIASGGTTVFHYQANVTPPKDIRQWKLLIRKLVGHWVKRYGRDEVRTWFFEVWNEPNMAAFWPSTRDHYFELYRHTVETIKEIDDGIRVGGPATAKDEWIAEFLDFCDLNRLPVDFVSTHHYPTDALGSAADDTEAQLAESQRSVLREWAQNTRRKSRDYPLYYTEWNTSSNPRDSRHDEPYSAAVIVKTMMEAQGLVEGYSFWTFSDIFSENYFPTEPFQGGFGLLTIENVAKPAYRAFQLLHQLGAQRCLVDGIHETVDVWVCRDPKTTTVLLTNHALPRHPIRTEHCRVELKGIDRPQHVYVERIDEAHANPRRAWIEMGKPAFPSHREVDRLCAASELERESLPWAAQNRSVHFDLTIPPHGVAAVTLQSSLAAEGASR